jgi:hypothetical protein
MKKTPVCRIKTGQRYQTASALFFPALRKYRAWFDLGSLESAIKNSADAKHEGRARLAEEEDVKAAPRVL